MVVFLSIPRISLLWEQGRQQIFPPPISREGGEVEFPETLTSWQERQDGNGQQPKAIGRFEVSMSPGEYELIHKVVLGAVLNTKQILLLEQVLQLGKVRS